jgi:hypothetical protein
VEWVKVVNSEIILISGKSRDGIIKEEIFNEKGKKLKPYKQENKSTPRPHTVAYYRLTHGRYIIKKAVYLKNKTHGILYQSLEISEDGIKLKIEKCEGKLPMTYLQHLSAP